MSVYEELLKRKLISEENGQVNINKDHINQEKQNMQNNGLYLQEPKITSLWDRILSNAQKTQKNKTFFDDIGGTAENTWLGVKHGVEDASDYVDAIMDRFRTKPTGSQISMSRVIGSNKLSDIEKSRYLMTKINPELSIAVDDNMVNNISTLSKNFNLPIDKEKLNQKRQEILQKYNQSPTRQKIVEILKQDKEKIDQIANNPSEIENAFAELGKQKEKTRQEEEFKIQQNVEKSTNEFTGKLAELAPSVGNMATGAVLTAVNPVLGSTYFMTSAGGSYLKDARERGMDEDQALIYATVMGGVEGLSEELTWGNLSKAGKAMKTFVGSAGKEAVKEGAKQVATNSLKEGLKSYGIGIAENTIQEAIIEPIQEFTAGVVADKANWENMPERMLNAGVNGGLIALITGGADVGVQSCVAVQEKIKNGENITQEEIQASSKDATTALGEEKSQETFKRGSKTAIEMAKNEIDTQNETTTENKQLNVPTEQTNLPTQENSSNPIVEAQKKSNVANNQQNTKFITDLDKFKTGKYNQTDNIQVLDKLPDYFYNLGYETQYPLHLNMDKLQTIMKEPKGKVNGKNQHGITMDIIEDLPRAIENPLNVIKNPKFNNRFVIVTDLVDQYGDIVVVPVELNSSSNTAEITGINKITSIYGKDTYDTPSKDNLPSYMEQNKNNIVYDIDKERSSNSNYRLQLPSETTTTSSINNIIPQNEQEMQVQNEEKSPTRHEVIQNNRELARENIKNISKWKDKKSGLGYQLETMERNMYDIIPDKAEAQKMNNTYFEPIHRSEAEKQKFINKYNDRISALNLNKYESEAVQVLGEQKYNPYFNKDDVKDVLERVSNNKRKGRINEQKVNKAIETFRNIYDELFEIENQALRENGYEEKPYRKGYFPHFIDYVPETRTERVLNKLGFKIDKRPLPTNIAGITEQFVPGKTWNRSSLERKTNKTDYNALKGFDTYIAQASDNIFHTENIQRLRGLENEIRYQYSEKGIQTRIDEILNDETLYQEEKQKLIDSIFEQVDNPMPNLVTELRRYTNALANKKSEADRSMENMIGRPVYSTVNALENRFGANAVGLNIGSAVTNFIPITQSWSQIGTKNMGRAVIDTIKSCIKDDGFVDKSTFLTNRLNKSEKLYKTKWEKASDKASFLFNAIDDVTSNIVVRGKYLENIKNGMTETEAIKNADRFGANVIADRSKGALPTKFEEKNPLTKMFTQFQLEVNNQYRYMFKDLPRDLKDKGLGALAIAFFKMFIGAWLYNEASEAVTGRRPAFDPIDIAVSSYKTITDDDVGTYDKIAKIGKEIGEEIPFVGGLMGGGRIPINGALPDVGNVVQAGIGMATGETDSTKAGATIGKELSKPLYYILPPLGGAQIKKSVEGIQAVNNGGSYGVDSKGQKTLQFPVEDKSIGNYLKAGLFGKYALPEAKKYTESGYKSLNAKQTKTYEESKIPYKEYLEYLDQDLKKDSDKINYINQQNWGTTQKWGIYTNDIFSTTERKDGSSQLSDAQYITSNGVSKEKYIELYNKAQSNNVEMPKADEYKEMKDAGVKLDSYVDYKINVKNEKQKQQKDGIITDTQDLKDKDKIQILINSKYDQKEKAWLYENEIGTDDNLYETVKDSININQYLDYKIRNSNGEFKADKYENGKTINGTAKSKLYEYVNTSISGYQNRLAILGQNYKLSRSEQEALLQYLLTTSNKKENIENFSKNFEVKDGKVYYK